MSMVPSDSEGSVSESMIRWGVVTLSDGEREVLLLFYQEGCTHQEMARRLGISEMNSRTRLFRARNHCKKLLEKSSSPCHI